AGGKRRKRIPEGGNSSKKMTRRVAIVLAHRACVGAERLRRGIWGRADGKSMPTSRSDIWGRNSMQNGPVLSKRPGHHAGQHAERSDERLVERVAAGDRLAMEALYARH